jgi:hypothetical protein
MGIQQVKRDSVVNHRACYAKDGVFKQLPGCWLSIEKTTPLVHGQGRNAALGDALDGVR